MSSRAVRAKMHRGRLAWDGGSMNQGDELFSDFYNLLVHQVLQPLKPLFDNSGVLII